MKVSTDGKKIVVFDVVGPYSRENICFDWNIAKSRTHNYSPILLYDECLKGGIQCITPDVYFALPHPRPKAICMRERDDADMSVSLALKRAGVRLAVVRSSENPFYACRFYWNIPRITSYFDHSFLMGGLKNWVSPKSQLHPHYTPHVYYSRVRSVEPRFRTGKFLCMIQRNVRVHWLRRLYVDVWNTLKPMPTFENREGYKDRMEAVRYFSKYPDFDLYGYGWDEPVRYTHRYDDAIHKSWRGEAKEKHETLQQYKFSLCFENSYLGGYVQYMHDALYAGTVPIYWGAPDIADAYPENCFIDFRKFDCNYARLDEHLHTMDEKTYNEYIKNINAWIASPAAYARSQEGYVRDMAQLFDSYF